MPCRVNDLADEDDAEDVADGDTKTADTKPKAVGNYRASAKGIEYYARTAKGGDWVALTNFQAEIVSQIRLDDGVEMLTTFEIEASINGRTSTFLVQAAQFSNMNWVLEHLGAEAVVQPGQGAKDRVRDSARIPSFEGNNVVVGDGLGILCSIPAFARERGSCLRCC